MDLQHAREGIRPCAGRPKWNSRLAPLFWRSSEGWDFVSQGEHGSFERVFRALNDVGYKGPLSAEWEDNGMDRDQGAPEALALVKRLELTPSQVSLTKHFSGISSPGCDRRPVVIYLSRYTNQ